MVFLLREGLQRDPGDFGDFAPARKIERLPVVLAREEVQIDLAIGFRLSAVG